jgi:hypothetical protein
VAIRRRVFTTRLLKGDYVLSTTGYTWNVRRSNGDGSVQEIVAGARDRSVAHSRLVSLADADKTDAWETAGNGSFCLLERFRPALIAYGEEARVATLE